MTKILDQSLLNNMLKGERELFPRSNAFYYSDSLAIKISKVVFPIFIVCYLLLTVKDAIDIALSKKHFKRITPTEFAKNKSNQFISKYRTTIIAAGALVALGYAAYKFLPNQSQAQIGDSIKLSPEQPKPPKIQHPIEEPDITSQKSAGQTSLYDIIPLAIVTSLLTLLIHPNKSGLSNKIIKAFGSSFQYPPIN